MFNFYLQELWHKHFFPKYFHFYHFFFLYFFSFCHIPSLGCFSYFLQRALLNIHMTLILLETFKIYFSFLRFCVFLTFLSDFNQFYSLVTPFSDFFFGFSFWIFDSTYFCILNACLNIFNSVWSIELHYLLVHCCFSVGTALYWIYLDFCF